MAGGSMEINIYDTNGSFLYKTPTTSGTSIASLINESTSYGITDLSCSLGGEPLNHEFIIRDIPCYVDDNTSISLYAVNPEPETVTKARFKAYINGQQMGVYTETAI